MRKREQAAIRMLDYSNCGVDALVRLYKNGRLRAEMIPDYTWSLMKDHGLDLLFGSEKGRICDQTAKTFCWTSSSVPGNPMTW